MFFLFWYLRFWPGCSSFRRQHLHLGRQFQRVGLLMWINGMYEIEPTWIKISMETSLVMLGRSHTQLGMKSHDWLAGYMCIPGLRCQWRSVRGIYMVHHIYIYILGVSWIFPYLVNWLLHFKLFLYTKTKNHWAVKKKMNKKTTWMIGTLRIWVEYGTYSYFRRSNIGTPISIQLAMSHRVPALISADPKARRTPLERRLH